MNTIEWINFLRIFTCRRNNENGLTSSSVSLSLSFSSHHTTISYFSCGDHRSFSVCFQEHCPFTQINIYSLQKIQFISSFASQMLINVTLKMSPFVKPASHNVFLYTCNAFELFPNRRSIIHSKDANSAKRSICIQCCACLSI